MAAAYGHTRAGRLPLDAAHARDAPRGARDRSSSREERLAFFGERLMGYRWDQPAYSLSYANRRRLEIARATATNPRLLLLDEPAAGMNPAETHEITELIGSCATEGGYTILVIEHDMHVVEGISDRVVALDHGVKIAEGSFDAGRDRREGRRGVPRPADGVDEMSASLAARARRGRHLLRPDPHPAGRCRSRVERGRARLPARRQRSGKSTTLKTILGIVRPRNGAVRVRRRGRDAAADELPDRRAGSRSSPRTAGCSRR